MNPSYYDKWRYTLYTTFTLLLLFNQYAIQFTQTLFRKFKVSLNMVFIIHVVVFTFILRYMMDYDI